MSGSLPSYYDGVVERTVYFAELRGRCYSRSTSVWVQNCGSFYVYYFKRYAMTCNYRFCGSDDYTSSIIAATPAATATAGSISPTPVSVRVILIVGFISTQAHKHIRAVVWKYFC